MQATRSRSLNDLLTCPVCLETFKDPRVLRCLHSFCSSCLVKCKEVHRRDISCPVCKKNTMLHAGDIMSLDVDFRIQQLKDALLVDDRPAQINESSVGTDDDRMCDFCATYRRSSTATFHCMQCSMYFCESCNIRHGENNLFTNHHVISLMETSNSQQYFCQKHCSQMLRYFCRVCRMMMCTLCIMEHDASHLPIPIERETIEMYQSNLRDFLNKVQSKLTDVKSKAKRVEVLKCAQKHILFEVQAAIHARCEELIRKIRCEESALISDAQNLCEQKLRSTGLDLVGDISYYQTKLESLILELQALLTGSLDQCLMDSDELIGRTKAILDQNLPASPKQTDPVMVRFVSSSVDVTGIVGSLENCSITSTNSYAAANEAESKESALKCSAARKRTVSIMSVLGSKQKEVRLSKIKSVNKGSKIKDHEECQAADETSVRRINADDLIESSSTTSIQCTSGVLDTLSKSEPLYPTLPTSPGVSRSETLSRVELSRSPPGSPTSTTNEPSNSCYSISSLRQLFAIEQAPCWPRKIESPSSVAFYGPDRLIVAECESRLQMVAFNGCSVNTIGGGLIKPQSVAITKDNLLAVTDKKDQTVKFWHPSDQIISTWTSKMFGMPSGIAVMSSGNFVVTDVDRHCFSVHRPSGSVITKSGSWGEGLFHNPMYVTVDSQDNIYISDSYDSSVKVFDCRGTFVRKLMLRTSASGPPIKPHGIFVDCNDQIIVCCRDIHQVSLFSNNGNFLTHLLTEQNGLKYPCTVAVSNDGQLVAVVESHGGYLANSHHAVKLFALHK